MAKYLPLDCLPKDYGGKEMSFVELEGKIHFNMLFFKIHEFRNLIREM